MTRVKQKKRASIVYNTTMNIKGTLPISALMCSLVASLAIAAGASAATSALEAGFLNPPDSAKPHVWYHMMNGNVTKEGITCDFEALAEAGIGGVQMFDAGCSIPAGPVAFNSPEWFDIIRHAASEARRLGLEICIPNCSGWSSSGGPWNPPENGMKTIVFTETPAKGPSRFSGTLSRRKDDHGYYEDIAVIAYPAPKPGLQLSNLELKTFAYRDPHGKNIPLPRDEAIAEPGQTVRIGDEIDLSSVMSADGALVWDVPDGDWLILRIGAICNGKCNHPASKHGRGLEVDKLSASAVDYHFDQYVARLCQTLGPLAGDVASGLNNILVDSYEVGCQNWTQGLDAIFERRIGYSMRPWLPVFAGRVVGSVEESERFLEDFRRVVADLFAENYAGRLAWNCHRFGLKFSLEPYGNCPSDHLQYGRSADIPMGECWSRAMGGDHVVTPGAGKFAASVAHVWGRRYVGMESFTANPSTGGRWQTTPFTIKAQCDRIYTEGINRVIYHRFVHQPWPGSKYLPGMTMGRWGMHLDRTQTWWRHVGAWFRYQTRCQWMLQEGRPVADVLFYAGGHVPNQGRQTDGVANPDDMKLPYGYDWDICDTEALEALRVVDGKVVAPGGVAYSLLVLPPHDTMDGRVLAAVGRLVESGAKICGMAKPVRSPGLAGWPDADARVREMADRIWAKDVMQCTPAEALERLALAPDFDSDARDLWSGAAYIHRCDAETDWYFVACNNSTDRIVHASFRQTGRIPEIWDAETGDIAEARRWRMENGRTAVELRFPPSGSAFVVFRRETAETQSPLFAEAPISVASAELAAPWRVLFPVEWYSGGNAAKTFEWNSLQDWTASDDPDIRFFSGTATYSTRIRIPLQRSERLVLDLGEVKNFAVVTVNGTRFPVLWRPPFRVDITDALEPGDTSFALEVEVTNLWPNRLIGDDYLPEDCEWEGTVKNGVKEIGIKALPDWVKRGERSPTGRHTFTTWKHWDRNDALLPSGLLGSITLRMSSGK